ncbi:hypothetical protein GH733_003224 [Mirounga leonina]|nr:hypothetical protein GH733_003224 [Mirounga leonina]
MERKIPIIYDEDPCYCGPMIPFSLEKATGSGSEAAAVRLGMGSQGTVIQDGEEKKKGKPVQESLSKLLDKGGHTSSHRDLVRSLMAFTSEVYAYGTKEKQTFSHQLPSCTGQETWAEQTTCLGLVNAWGILD